MHITYTQNAKLFFLKLIIYSFWGLEQATLTAEKLILNFTLLTLIGFTLIFNRQIVLFPDTASFVSTGIFSTLYYRSYGRTNYNNASVLGGADSRTNKPLKVNTIEFPAATAKSILIADLNSSEILYAYNDMLKFAPASTTKLMTALVALDLFKPDEKVTVPEACTLVEGQKTGLPALSKYTARDLLYSLLVNSGADSACTLATAKTTLVEFVTLMNQKAQTAAMENTYFTNPIGLDGDYGTHYSTAQDLYKLAKISIKTDLIKEIVKTKDYLFDSQDGKYNFKISNTNQLLWLIPESAGIKTGKTYEAGEVLIYEYSDKNKDLIIIVMGSANRFEDTSKLLEWTLESYQWN